VIKRPITYKTFNGETVTEVFAFHLKREDVMKLSLKHKEGMEGYWREMIASDNRLGMFDEFETFVQKSYGTISPDGKRFIQNQQLLDEFMQTNAYGTLLMEITTDEGKAAEFFMGIMPEGLEEDVAKVQSQSPPQQVASVTQHISPEADPTAIEAPVDGEVVVPRILTREEIMEMDLPELQAGIASGKYKLQ
jgi:hypothetical protein